MYATLLFLHSWIRWIALVAVVGATLAVVRGKVQGNSSLADRWGLVAVTALDIQMLIGLILYFVVSPNMQAIRADFGAAMKDPQARFWAVEHITAMLVALVLVHLGRVLARKARTPAAKRTRLLVCFGVATVAMFLGTPWPGTAAGRPWFRI